MCIHAVFQVFFLCIIDLISSFLNLDKNVIFIGAVSKTYVDFVFRGDSTD